MKLKQSEMMALGLAALAVYFVVKGRSKAIHGADPAPPPAGHYYDKNGTLRRLPPPSGEQIFTNQMLPDYLDYEATIGPTKPSI